MNTTRKVDTDRSLSRLRQLVDLETPSGHVPGLDPLYELLASWSGGLLGESERVVVDGVPHLYVHERVRDPATAPVLLLGHADTVWPLGTLAERPFTVAEGRVTGPGVFDMKAGLVTALDALELTGGADDVRMLVTGDEERGSLTSRALIEEAAAGCRAVLVLEPSRDGAVKTARKGVAMYRLGVRGRAAHAGLEPELGVNALVELAHQVLAISGLGDTGRGTTVTPTVGRAGTTTNTVPESGYVDVDVRAWERAELERVEDALNVLCSRLPGAGVELAGVSTGPRWNATCPGGSCSPRGGWPGSRAWARSWRPGSAADPTAISPPRWASPPWTGSAPPAVGRTPGTSGWTWAPFPSARSWWPGCCGREPPPCRSRDGDAMTRIG